MKEFFENLENQVYEAVKQDIKPVLKEAGDEKIYAAALVTDSDCITLYLAVNTEEFCKKTDEKYLTKYKDNWSEQERKEIRDGKKNLTKWNPAEWGYADGKGSELTKISQMLFQKEEQDWKEYGKHQDEFFEKVTLAFQKIVQDKVFGEASDKVTCFVSISDDERTIEIENRSAKELNSKEVCEAFLKRTDA